MTRKDYKLIADAVKSTRHCWLHPKDEEAASYILDELANILANKLANDNSRFNRDKFIVACGGQG